MSAFANYYNAGLSGSSGITAQNPHETFTGDIAPSAQLAAFRAGVHDAQTIKNAVYFGQDAGFVRDKTYSKSTMTSDTANLLDGFAKSVGIKIVMADKILDSGGAEVRANASHSNGVLTLSTSCNSPFLTAATHEFAHRLRETEPQSYNEVQALIVGAMDSTELSRGIDTRMGLYSGVVDAQPSAENMTEEVIGDALGQLLGNKEFYKSLPPQHRNVLQKLADFFHDLLLKIRKALSRGKEGLGQEQYKEFTDLEKAVNDVMNTIKNAISRADAVNKTAPKYKQKTVSASDIPQYSLKKTRHIPYEEQLEAYNKHNTDILGRNDDIFIAETSALEKYATEKRPVAMLKRTLEKSIRERGNNNKYSSHGISQNIILKLPELIQTPLIVVKRSSRISLITKEKTYSDKARANVPVLVGIAINSDTFDIPSHEVKSIYGIDFVRDWLLQRCTDSEIYIEKGQEKKAADLLRDVRLQLSEPVSNRNLSNLILSQNKSSVNTENAQGEKGSAPPKFSLQDLSGLQRENAKLNALNAHLREQLKISQLLRQTHAALKKSQKQF